MSKAYMIAGGGSGAKVVEAMTFLCAAGMGPDELTILLVDCDAHNGNLQRATDTVKSYQALRQWPWQTKAGGAHPFRTLIRLSKLDAPIENTAAGLDHYVDVNDKALLPGMRLLFDFTELKNPFAIGFKGRPNVGSLLLSQHLFRHLSDPTSSSGNFMRLLKEAASAATAPACVPVMVVGSIFGGTGASLIPVVHGCVKKVFDADAPVAANFNRLSWARCMLAPYFRPTRSVSDVNPEIFKFNASVALKYYNRAVYNGKTYLVGSFDAALNMVEPQVGDEAQCNPGYIEEVLAAIGMCDFMETARLRPVAPAAAENGAVRDFHVLPLQLERTEPRLLDLRDLPLTQAQSDGLAYLLHLGAFFLRRGAGGMAQHDMGLFAYLQLFVKGGDDRKASSLRKVPWFASHVHPWAAQLGLDDIPKGAGAALCANRLLNGAACQCVNAQKDVALDFFARLLLWASGVFNKTDVKGIAYEPALNYFQSIHSTMCLKDLPPDKVNVDDAQSDNVLARMCRIALAAMRLEQEKTRRGRSESTIPLFVLWSGSDAHAKLNLALDEKEIVGMVAAHANAAVQAKVNRLANGYRAKLAE